MKHCSMLVAQHVIWRTFISLEYKYGIFKFVNVQNWYHISFLSPTYMLRFPQYKSRVIFNKLKEMKFWLPFYVSLTQYTQKLVGSCKRLQLDSTVLTRTYTMVVFLIKIDNMRKQFLALGKTFKFDFQLDLTVQVITIN